MAPLSEELTFDIGPGLAQAEVLGSAFDAIAQSFGASLSSAIDSAFGSIDISALSNLTLGADGSAVTAEGEAAVAAIDPTIVLQADTADLIAQGDAAMQSVFEAQVSNVAQGVGNTQGIIASGADVAGVTEGIDALTGATKSLEVANAGLEGSVGGVTSAFGPLGVATAGLTALAGGFFTEAVNEETALNRLEFVFGDLASSIQQVNLPANNFNLTFQQIADTTGASLPGLEQTVSRIGAIGNSAGAAAPQIAETAKQIVAIATYLAVTNPALGTADEIVNTLTNSLQRGGRSASLLGLSLPTKELNAAAQAVAGAGNEVSQFDKIQAGAAIVANQLGTSLGTAVTSGANEAALALPKLKEQLKETIAAVGAPLIGPITQLFAEIAPPLEQVVTAIGHLLQAAAPLGAVLGIVLKVLGDLASIVTAIPIPILTTAIEAFTAALVFDKVTTFAAGLFTLGANATADVGAVGLLTGAVDTLVASLGPLGIVIAVVGTLSVVSREAQQANTSEANKMALAVAGIKAGADLSKESASQLQSQLDTVNSKIAEIKKQNPSGSSLVPTIVSVDGKTQILSTTDALKALQGQAGTLTTAIDKTKSSTDGLAGSDAAAAKSAADFGAAIQTEAAKLNGVGAAMASVESANAALVSTAVGKMPGVAGVFGDVSTAIDAAAKASETQATSSGSASNAMAQQAQHAKDLRDATASLNVAEKDFAILAAGPDPAKLAQGLDAIHAAARTVATDIETVAADKRALDALTAGPDATALERAFIADAQAAKTVSDAEQKIVDIKLAIDTLAHPSADTTGQADENIAKATLARQKAVLGLSDATTALQALEGSGTATDRQILDAKNNVTTAEFAQEDASRALNTALAARAKITTDSQPGSAAMRALTGQLADATLSLQSAQLAQNDTQAKGQQLINDSLPGSAAIEAATNKWADAVDKLHTDQRAQIDTQAQQDKLINDSLPGSEARAAALAKIADAQDHLTQVEESGNAATAKSAAASAKTHVDALQALSDGLDQQLAAENKFYADLQKIQTEGGTEIVAELLSQGPKTGAAEATAVAGATVTVVQALETKAQKLKDAEDTHAQEIATLFGASLNANLLKAFSLQLKNETDFFNNIQAIFVAGDTALANELIKQGPIQGAALAQAVATATPVFRAQLEAQAEQVKVDEARFGTDIGKTFGDGLVAGINGANARVFAAAQAAGAAAQQGTSSAIAAKSPSRIAMELGQKWAEGLALGITGGIPLVSDAATRIADSLSPAVFASLNDLLASSVQIASGVVTASNLANATVAVPSIPAQAAVTAVQAPSIVNNFQLPAGITDPQGVALAVSARQAMEATR